MKVRIFKPARSTMTSGRAKTRKWVIEAIPTSKRQPEPLMGWISSEDTLNQILLKQFDSADEAVNHAEREGWDYSVATVQARKVKPRSYMDNFKHFSPEENG